MQVGVDIGGTFTDIMCMKPDGSMIFKKVSSTVHDYSRSIAEALPEIAREHAVNMKAVKGVVHGTTVATNAILQGTGAKTGLITTKGFRDVLELRRIRMPELYNWFWDKPPDLVERANRQEVTERIDAAGNILVDLKREEIERVVDDLHRRGVQSLAICLINSYANPCHEEQIAAVVRERYPELQCSISSEILREMKEYERTATVVVNAYVLPLMHDYISALGASLAKINIRAPLLIMQSNGGIVMSQTCVKKPVFSIESGPAAGVVASHALAKAAGIPNAITFDMGGTTAKASIIEKGQLNLASEYEVGSSLSLVSRLIRGGGHLIRIPAIDIAEVGAGGGSIAWLDKGGGLQVGPQSAGSDPGPVCYELGGKRLTITDANLVLGYINPAGLAGGAVRLNRDRSVEELEAQVGTPLGLSLLKAAYGIHLIANANMMRAIRSVSTERGRDVREYTLIAFGGSGPIHAAGMARSLGMKEVVVPLYPGLFSACGLLFADVQHDSVQTYFRGTRGVDFLEINQTLAAMEREAKRTLREEGFTGERVIVERWADLRYVGQCFELTIPLPGGRLDKKKLQAVERAFDDEHEKTYGHGVTEGAQYTFVNLRVRGKGLRQRTYRSGTFVHKSGERQSRKAYFGEEHGLLDVPIISRAHLVRKILKGPLLVDEYDSTTVVPPGSHARLDRNGNIRIQIVQT
jgi:N-methylhydantoinase A